MGLINLWHIKQLQELISDGVKNPTLLKNNKYWAKVIGTAIKIEEIRIMLKGYKTYIIAILSGTLTVMKALGYIDETTYNTLMALLVSGGMATVSAKINRIQKDVNPFTR